MTKTKYKFEILWDSESKVFSCNSDDLEVAHSGSSYLRLKAPGLSGTIGVLPLDSLDVQYLVKSQRSWHLVINLMDNVDE